MPLQQLEYQGSHVWIWNAAQCGSLQEICDKAYKAMQMGLKGVLIKSHEGSGYKASDGTNFMAQLERLTSPLHDMGIIIGAWGYNYFTKPQKEVEMILESMDIADWYVFDAEDEVEHMDNAHNIAKQVLEQVVSVNPGKPIGYAPYCYPSMHPAFPYHAFDEFCDVVLPQCYWKTIGASPSKCIERTILDFINAGLDATPFAPVGQLHANASGFRPTLKEIQEFRQLLSCPGFNPVGGMSWWSWQHATEEGWRGITEPLELDWGIAPKLVSRPPLRIGNKGIQVRILQHLLQMPEVTGLFDAKTLWHVATYQQSNKLTVDGAVGPKTWGKLYDGIK